MQNMQICLLLNQTRNKTHLEGSIKIRLEIQFRRCKFRDRRRNTSAAEKTHIQFVDHRNVQLYANVLGGLFILAIKQPGTCTEGF